MFRSSRVAVGVVVAIVLAAWNVGWAQTQPSLADLAKMVGDLKNIVEQNTQEISKLQKAVADKDKALAQKDEEISKLKAETSDLGKKVSKVDTIEGTVKDYIKEAEAKKEKPMRENEFGVLIGGMSGPYDSNSGAFFGGFLDFAWIPRDPLGNKISGELLAMFGQTEQRYAQVTSAVLGEQGRVTQEIDTLAVIAGLKYTVVNNNLGPFRPYFVTGPGMYVFGQDMSNDFTIGQVPPAAELRRNHSPSGNADLQFGWNIGGGVEWRINDYIGIGWDMRHNIVTGKSTDFTTIGGYLSLNF